MLVFCIYNLEGWKLVEFVSKLEEFCLYLVKVGSGWFYCCNNSLFIWIKEELYEILIDKNDILLVDILICVWLKIEMIDMFVI